MPKRHRAFTTLCLAERTALESRHRLTDKLAKIKKAEFITDDMKFKVLGMEINNWLKQLLSALFLKNHVAMIAEKFRIRFGKFIWEANRFSGKRNEILFQRWLREKLLQAIAQDHIQAFIKGNQAGIKRSIVNRRKAKTVAWIQTLFRKFTPRFDMASYQQARNVDAADTATDIIGIENGLSEKLLATANFYRAASFGWPNRRHETDAITFKKIQLLIFVLGEQAVQYFFALSAECSDLATKLIPHFFVLLRRTGQAFDASRLLHRIKRSEVAQFHSKTAWLSSHFSRDLNDKRIAFVKLAKFQFAVNIQRDEEMLTFPLYRRRFCHARRLLGLGFHATQTVYA